jgi:tripartite-type tricarboxylate transporter receptor subunit TctC
MSNRLGAISVAVVTLALAASALADTYPTKPVTVVVPWAPGGRTDLTARLTTQFLAEKMGKPFVVVNHNGASGVLGAKKVSTSRPDGYTLGFFSSGVVATQYTVPTPSDLKDYDPVGLVNMDEAVVAVAETSPFKTLAELVAYARAHPNELKRGAAPGTSAEIMAGLFGRAAKVEFLGVPFGGGGARSVALAGKHIDVDIDVPAIYKPLVEAKKIRILGIGAEKRNPLFPDVPTFREQGIDCVIGSWNGLFAPKGTPADVLAALEAGLGKVTSDQKFVDLMHRTLLAVNFMDRETFRQFLSVEDQQTKDIVTALEIKAPNN